MVVTASRWHTSRRRDRFNPGWSKRRLEILDRDGHMCQWPVMDPETGERRICGRPARAVDHRRRAEDGRPDDDSWTNLWSLCDDHHQYKTEQESAEARRENRRRREERQWYSHPAFR